MASPGLAGNAAVAIWNDITPELREDFLEWHPREHMVERLGIPGFLRGRRCVAVDATVEFFTMYEIENTGVLNSDVYRTRLNNPTPWSTKTLPGFFNNVRGACNIEFTAGPAMGGFLLTLRFEAEEGKSKALIEAVKRDVMPIVPEQPRVTGAHFIVNDVGLTGGNAGMQRGRMILLPEQIILIEGSSAEGVRAAGDKLASDRRLVELGAKPEVIRDLFQLEYSIASIRNG